ncbi:MAG: SBBP repeat-containing protein, partial [Candidatus Jettenia caeni]|nr:SBBP repeat-containing protein [Candidatus Jettenia caeni]
MNRNLTKLLASTYLGGKDYDYSSSIAIASDENLYITGNTWSSGFPTTANAYDIFLDGPSDAFISKFDGSLKNLLSSTYLGGNDYDYGQSIIVDADVNVIVVGQTYSSNFPTTYGVFAPAHGGYYDVFISVFPGDLASLLGSTYLGGSGYDYGESVTIDSSRSLRHGA